MTASWACLRAATGLAGCALLAACGKPPNHDECDALLDHYVELLVNSDRPGTTAGELHKLQVQARQKATSDPAFSQCGESLLLGHGTAPAERRDQSVTGHTQPSLRPKRFLQPWRSRFGRSDCYFWDMALVRAGKVGDLSYWISMPDSKPLLITVLTRIT
jgi:hypothetical protein